MSEGATPERAAEIWLSATGSTNIAHFGGAQDKKLYWDQFKAEFHRFVCDENSYSKEKKELQQLYDKSHTAFVSVISAAIGATIGLAATLLVPAVALLLYVTARIGVGAYCKMDSKDNFA